MATFQGIILVVALCIANGVFKVTSQKNIEDEHLGPATVDDKYVLPKVTPSSYLEFLKACENKMTDQCAKEIADTIFKKKHVSNECCVTLVSMGDDCHNELTARFLLIPEFQQNKTELKSKSDHIWNNCSGIAKKIAPAPSAFDDAPKFPSEEELPQNWKILEQCVRKVNHKCADQIFGGITENKEVTRECCVQLVDMGGDCHNELLKQLIKASPTTAIATKVKLNSDRIWKKCEIVALSPSAPKAFT